MQTPSVQELVKVGAHIGHIKNNWNPKAKAFIVTRINGVDIIDLEKSIKQIQTAQEFLKEVVSKGGNVLFVGTKRQAKKSIEEIAKEVGMPFVSSRWLGGTLTNFSTIRRRCNYFERKEAREKTGAFEDLSKKDKSIMQKELLKLKVFFDGLRKLRDLPSAIIIIDPNIEQIAFREAKQLKIPVIATADTNIDWTKIDYPVSINDDNSDSIFTLLSAFSVAIKEGLKNQVQKVTQVTKQ